MSERKAQFFSGYSRPKPVQPQVGNPEQSPGGLEVGILQRAPSQLRGYGKLIRGLKSTAGRTKDAVQTSANAATTALSAVMELDRAVKEAQQNIAALDAQVKHIDEVYAHRRQLIEQISATRMQAAQAGYEPPSWADYNSIVVQPTTASSLAREVLANPTATGPAAGAAAGAVAGSAAQQLPATPATQAPATPAPDPNRVSQEQGYKKMMETQLAQQYHGQRAPLVFQRTRLGQQLKDLQAKYQQAYQSYEQANADFNEALGKLNNQTAQMNQLASELQDYQETTLAAWHDTLSGIYGVKDGDEL